MKKYLLLSGAVLLLLNCVSCATGGTVTTADNSRTSLNWEGVYTGVIPAADAEGIRVELTLNEDQTYKLAYQYIGKGDDVFVDAGTFKWDDEGGTIILDTRTSPPYYKVGENILIQLDMNGKTIRSQFADMYILKKQD